MLERYHYLVQLAKQRHKLPNAQLFRIGADRTACDTVIASSLMRLTNKIHLERCGILLFLFGRVPFYIFYDVLFIFRLTLFRVKVGLSEIPFDMIKGAPHHFLHCLRGYFLFACNIGSNEHKRKQLVVCHRVVVAYVISLRHQFAIDRFALFYYLSSVFVAVFFRYHLFHRAFEHPKIKAVIFHCAYPPACFVRKLNQKVRPSRPDDRS